MTTLAPELLAATDGNPQALADALLKKAMTADKGRPCDDISVLVVAVTSGGESDKTRRMSVSFPIR